MKISKDQIVLECAEDRELIFESLYLYYLRCYDFADSNGVSNAANSLLFCKKIFDQYLDALMDKVDSMIECFDDVSFGEMPCIRNHNT